MTNNIYWILKANIGEGNLAALKELAAKFCHMTQEEPGVVAYEWSVSEDGKVLHIYERYADSDAGLAHLANVGPSLPELMALVTPVSIECYGNVGDNLKDAMKALPMSYMETFAGFHK